MKNETEALDQRQSRYSIPALLVRGAAQVSGDRMLSIAGAVCKVGFSRTTIYEMMGRNEFPKPVKLSPRRVAWRESALDTWLAQREAA